MGVSAARVDGLNGRKNGDRKAAIFIFDASA
jgi:hypothetical protein